MIDESDFIKVTLIALAIVGLLLFLAFSGKGLAIW